MEIKMRTILQKQNLENKIQAWNLYEFRFGVDGSLPCQSYIHEISPRILLMLELCMSGKVCRIFLLSSLAHTMKAFMGLLMWGSALLLPRASLNTRASVILLPIWHKGIANTSLTHLSFIPLRLKCRILLRYGWALPVSFFSSWSLGEDVLYNKSITKVWWGSCWDALNMLTQTHMSYTQLASAW